MKKELNILIAGSFSPGSLSESFGRSLTMLGNKVDRVDIERHYRNSMNFASKIFSSRFFKRVINFIFWKKIAQKTNEIMKDQCNKKSYDLILVMKGWELSPKTLREVKALNPHVKLFCFTGDNPLDKKRFSDSNSWIRKSISLYDAYFIWAESLKEQLINAGAKKVFNLPVAYDPVLHYPVIPSVRERDKFGSEIAFIGTWDKDREEWLSELTNYNLKIWGNLWENSSESLKKCWQKKEAIGKEFSKICNSTKIMINFVRKPEIPSHNMRNFEIPACKGFQLCTRTEEIKKYFRENKDIVLFESKQEMKEKVDYFLKHEAIRERIIRAGYKINKKNTYLERMKFLLKVFYLER